MLTYWLNLIDYQNTLFIYHELYVQLDDLYRTMNYLNKEIIGEFELYLNESERFEAFEGTYYTSGSTIEFLYDTRWCKSRVEHDGERYYILHYKEVPLPGLTVRVRR